MTAPRCSAPRCGRTTLDPSGRCHDHRGASAGSGPTASLSTPSPSSEPVRTIEKISGGITVERYRVGGKHHRDDGPAVVTTQNGAVVSEQWFREGMLYRPDGPAETRWSDGRIEAEFYRTRLGDYPEFHREDGPAVIEYFFDGKTPFGERWFIEGKKHRVGAPAVIYHRYDKQGPRGGESEQWFENGELHRLDGPAVVVHGSDGASTSSYYRRGRKHRLDGPCEVHSVDPESGMWAIEGSGFESREQALRNLRNLPTAKVRELLRDSIYAPLLEDTPSSRSIVDVLATGVTTPGGVREVLAGAPAEWVRSFEKGFFAPE